MESLTLRCWRGGGGWGGPGSPGTLPWIRHWELNVVSWFCLFFFPWYSAIETPSAPTKAAAPVAATRQDVYAGKWGPKITNSRNYQISFVHSVFIQLAALLLHELFLQCYDEDFKRMLYRKSVTFGKFLEIQWEMFIKLPLFSPLQSFSLRSWVTKGNRKIVFSLSAKFLLAKLEHFSVGVKFCLLVYLFVFFHITC